LALALEPGLCWTFISTLFLKKWFFVIYSNRLDIRFITANKIELVNPVSVYFSTNSVGLFQFTTDLICSRVINNFSVSAHLTSADELSCQRKKKSFVGSRLLKKIHGGRGQRKGDSRHALVHSRHEARTPFIHGSSVRCSFKRTGFLLVVLNRFFFFLFDVVLGVLLRRSCAAMDGAAGCTHVQSRVLPWTSLCQ
jgi:hypothetical protein